MIDLNEIVNAHAAAMRRANAPKRYCDDCGFTTTEQDVTVCPDPRCRGSVG